MATQSSIMDSNSYKANSRDLLDEETKKLIERRNNAMVVRTSFQRSSLILTYSISQHCQSC